MNSSCVTRILLELERLVLLEVSLVRNTALAGSGRGSGLCAWGKLWHLWEAGAVPNASLKGKSYGK